MGSDVDDSGEAGSRISDMGGSGMLMIGTTDSAGSEESAMEGMARRMRRMREMMTGAMMPRRQRQRGGPMMVSDLICLMFCL